MRRREFITLLGGAAAAWPLTARAQQAAMPLIGFMSSRSPEEAEGHTSAFLRGLKAFGYVDGQTATIKYRWARGQYDQLPALASELVGMHPAIIVAAGGTPSVRAAKAATSSIPIAFVTTDTVRAGLVAALNRPGGNATGVDLMTGELGGKRLELLTQVAPKGEVFGLLVNPKGEDTRPQIENVEIAAKTFSRRLIIENASTEAELESSFARLAKNGATGVVVQNDSFFDTRRIQLIALAAHHKICAIYHIREFPVAGGLMSYGPSLLDGYYQLGVQTGRVLKGADVADLPVVRPTQFQFVINLKTAGTLGLTVSPNLLALADEVIE
jgi:putative ABC transport system substrate-binding protein